MFARILVRGRSGAILCVDAGGRRIIAQSFAHLDRVPARLLTLAVGAPRSPRPVHGARDPRDALERPRACDPWARHPECVGRRVRAGAITHLDAGAARYAALAKLPLSPLPVYGCCK